MAHPERLQPFSADALQGMPSATHRRYRLHLSPAGSADSESLDGLLLMDSGLMVRGEPAATEPPGERRRMRDGPAGEVE